MKRKLGTAILLALSIGLFTACGVTAADSPVDETSQDLRRCLPDPGVPLGSRNEDAFVSCMNSCVGPGHSYSGCWAGCCQDFTGCTLCYIQ